MLPKKVFYQNQAKTIIKGLEKRNMEGYYCENKKEAIQKALELIKENSSISWGGSMTLEEIGLIEALNKGKFTLYDRSQAQTSEEIMEIYRKAFSVDYYLTSTNAITMDGMLINIDGNGNRVSAMIFGPDNVIVIAGMNKVVKNEFYAVERIRNFASPPNTVRLNIETPCNKTGKCYDCLNDNTICCHIVTTRISRQKNRIKVILVGEELGY